MKRYTNEYKKMFNTKREQCVGKFSSEHHSVLLFVVKFQTLQEIFVASLLLVLFALAVNRQELVEFHQFLALLFCSAKFLNGGVRWVQVEGPKNVSKVDGVDIVRAIGIVNGKGKFRLCSA